MHRNITSLSTYDRPSGEQESNMARVMDRFLENGKSTESPRGRPLINLNEAPPKKRQKPEESLAPAPLFDLKPALADEPSPQPPAGALSVLSPASFQGRTVKFISNK